MDDDIRKRALQDLADEHIMKILNASGPLRSSIRADVAKTQDMLTSNPNNDVWGPAAAAGLGIATDWLVKDPANDRAEDFIIGGIGSVGKVGSTAGRMTRTQLANMSDDAVMSKAIRAKPDLPPNMTPAAARAFLDRLLQGDLDGATQLLKSYQTMESQPSILRNIVRSEEGSAAVQPPPKVGGK